MGADAVASGGDALAANGAAKQPAKAVTPKVKPLEPVSR